MLCTTKKLTMTKYLTVLFTFIVIYNKYCTGFCIPCPRDGVTFTSFQDCNCPFGTFYNEATKSCITYFECPLPPYRDPLPEIKALSPLFHDVVSNALDSINIKNLHLPKDITLTIQALSKRYREVLQSLPGLLGPVIGSVVAKNGDLFELCKGSFICFIRETLKRENNYDLIFPKLRSALDEIIKKLHGVFDDLKVMADKSCNDDSDPCPLIKRLVRWKEVFPGSLDETLDVLQIMRQIRAYLLKDLRRRLDSLVKA